MNAEQNNPAPTYRPDIDGLRAIAVLGVLLYHAGVAALLYGAGSLGFANPMPGGFVGVDVFFVISGFLITGLIERDLRAGAFSLARFYERRVRRIFPALLVVLLAVLGATWLFSLADATLRTANESLAAVLSYANLHFYSTTNYFNNEIYNKPLLHTWSLSVEEQFYLALPLLLLSLRRARPTLRVAVLALLWVASFAAGWMAQPADPMAAFYFPHLRAWQLLSGSLLAYAPPFGGSRRVAGALSLVGATAIAASMLWFTDETAWPGTAALLPTLGTAALLYAGGLAGNPFNRFLGSAPMRFFGRISYSLYLWHWPVFLFGQAWLITTPTWWQSLALAALSVLLGWLGYRFVETPIRERAILPARWQAFAFLLTGAASVAGLSWALISGQGYPLRHGDDAQMKQLNVAFNDRFVQCNYTWERLDRPRKLKTCALPDGSAGKADTLFWGDSHGQALMPAFKQVAQDSGKPIEMVAYPGCRPYGSTRDPKLRATCPVFNQMVLVYLKNNPRITTVALTAYFKIDGLEAVEPQMDALLTELDMLDVRVVMIGSTPDFANAHLREGLFMARLRGLDANKLLRFPSAPTLRYIAEEQEMFQRLAAKHPNLQKYVDLAGVYCDEKLCRYLDGGTLWFVDDHHVSPAGAALAAPRIQKLLFGSTSP